MRLIDVDGNRLHLTQSERKIYLEIAHLEHPEVRTAHEM